MNIIENLFDDVKILEAVQFEDLRGKFIKTFHDKEFSALGLNFVPKEEFYSKSVKNVLRGFHFQIPPFHHQKLVYCTHGKVLDVIVDLRVGSSTYGECKEIELDSLNNLCVFIGQGFGHAFLSLEQMSCLVYKTDCSYSKNHDSGVLWNSVRYDWPIKAPVISERDSKFIRFSDFESPFKL